MGDGKLAHGFQFPVSCYQLTCKSYWQAQYSMLAHSVPCRDSPREDPLQSMHGHQNMMSLRLLAQLVLLSSAILHDHADFPLLLLIAHPLVGMPQEKQTSLPSPAIMLQSNQDSSGSPKQHNAERTLHYSQPLPVASQCI